MSDSQWVENVLAAGGCEMRFRGRDFRLVDPELIVDPARKLVPPPLRFIGRLGRVTEFVRMRAAYPDSLESSGTRQEPAMRARSLL